MSQKKRGRKVVIEEEKEIYGLGDEHSEEEVKVSAEEAKVIPYLTTNLIH